MFKSLTVIPCYNEGKRLSIETFHVHLSNYPHDALLFVNDGSMDNTSSIIFEIAKSHQNAFHLDLDKNRGKAEAVRSGINYAFSNHDFKFIGFFDADMAMPLSTVQDLYQILETTSYQVVIGTRFKRLGAKIERSKFRHFFGRVFATFAANVIEMGVYDTQCGAKIMTKEMAILAFKEKFISKWLFDIEVLARIKKGILNGENLIYEFPLKEWKEIGGSKIKLTDIFRFPIELLKIRRKYFFLE
ncbi:glycosyltransferase [Maribellus sediminis]|uniref:glycosyltransferase n=1 Tax=Maribellus sediminis TaxID=2696285 RepID=UPI00142F707B|nr:glycosyltransferase [Maribellus sediminis]